jgi:uncharacterized damage-inducible protein DinB
MTTQQVLKEAQRLYPPRNEGGSSDKRSGRMSERHETTLDAERRYAAEREQAFAEALTTELNKGRQNGRLLGILEVKAALSRIPVRP